MKNRIILVGAGGFGREVLAWSENAYFDNDVGDVSVCGFLDDRADALLNFQNDLPYLGAIASYEPIDGDFFLIGVADPLVKEKFVAELSGRGAKFVSLIHKSAVVASSAIVGGGTVICPHSLLSADAKLGSFVTLNALSSVGHDSVIGNFSTLSGHVDVTGQVSVGRSVFFGTGAKTLPRISIGDRSTIGAGTTIFRSVAAGATMYAMPAKSLSAIQKSEI